MCGFALWSDGVDETERRVMNMRDVCESDDVDDSARRRVSEREGRVRGKCGVSRRVTAPKRVRGECWSVCARSCGSNTQSDRGEE